MIGVRGTVVDRLAARLMVQTRVLSTLLAVGDVRVVLLTREATMPAIGADVDWDSLAVEPLRVPSMPPGGRMTCHP